MGWRNPSVEKRAHAHFGRKAQRIDMLGRSDRPGCRCRIQDITYTRSALTATAPPEERRIGKTASVYFQTAQRN